MADAVIGVSDFVVQRKIDVDLVPRARLRRIWNSIEPMEPRPAARALLAQTFGLEPGTPVVLCACRTVPEKGVDVLLRAFDLLSAQYPAAGPSPVLVYIGDGPAFSDLQRLRASLPSASHIHLAGYRADAIELVAGADVCVSPSVWEEAFGLSVLEPMALGVPVIGSAVGGIPEILVDGETGLLVPPADPGALAAALHKLLSNPEERARMSRNGAARAMKEFAREPHLRELISIVAEGLE